MRMTRLLLVLLPFGLSACQKPLASPPTSSVFVSVQSESDLENVWLRVQHVLRKHHFKIDRRDRSTRTITTFPSTSQYVGEFWRSDVASNYDALESSLQTVRRHIKVQIGEAQTDGSCSLSLAVFKERYHAKERAVNNAAAALRAFSIETTTTQGEPFSLEDDVVWSPAGRDHALEQRLLDHILADGKTRLADDSEQ